MEQAPVLLGDPSFRLSRPIESIAVSSDGTLLAAASGAFDSEAVVWDVRTGTVVARAEQPARGLVFEDAETLWLPYARLMRWRFKRGDAPELVSEVLCTPLAISPSGAFLAARVWPHNGGDIDILATDSRQLVRRVSVRGAPWTLAFSDDSATLAIGFDGGASLVDIASGRQIEVARSKTVVRVDGVHGAKVFLVTRHEGDAFLVRPNGTKTATLRALSSPDAAAVSREGDRIAMCSFGELRIIDATTGVGSDIASDVWGWSGVLFLSQTRLAAIHHHALRFFDLARLEAEPRAPGHDDGVAAIVVAPDRAFVGTAGDLDRTVHLWTLAGAHQKALSGHENVVLSIAASPDGSAIASGTRDGVLRVFEVATGIERCLVRNAHGSSDVAVAWSRDGSLATAGGDGRVVVRDAKTGGERHVLAARSSPQTFELDSPGIVFSHDGQWVAAVGPTETLAVYDVATKRPLLSRRAKPHRLSSAPDAEHLAFRDVNDLVVIDVPSAREIFRRTLGLMSDFTFLRGGLVACARDREVIVLDLTGADRVLPCQGVPSAIADAGDGRIAVGFANGTAAILSIPPTPLETRARAREIDLLPIRTLMRNIGVQRASLGYRDGPAQASLDPDGCGAAITDGARLLSVRGDCEAGLYALTLRPAREASPFADAEESALARVGRWVRELVGADAPPDWLTSMVGPTRRVRINAGRAITITCTLDALPSPQELEAWLATCAKYWSVEEGAPVTSSS